MKKVLADSKEMLSIMMRLKNRFKGVSNNVEQSAGTKRNLRKMAEYAQKQNKELILGQGIKPYDADMIISEAGGLRKGFFSNGNVSYAYYEQDLKTDKYLRIMDFYQGEPRKIWLPYQKGIDIRSWFY